MLEADRDYFLGCAGYFYRHWRGSFYPESLSVKDWLKFYSEHFNSLEINSTFYRFPTQKALRRFFVETPSEFTFSVKANRLITHIKRFKNTGTLVRDFYGVVSTSLREKLGCVLFQFPPSFKFSESKLSDILSQLDVNYTNVLEFRDVSWWREDVFEKLERARVVFCCVSSSRLPEQIIQTTSTLYVRFHGKESGHKHNYSEEELKKWTEDIKKTPAKRVFIYFNNDYNAYAPKNCLELNRMLSLR